MNALDTTTGSDAAAEPAPLDIGLIKAMVEKGAGLVAEGIQAGTTEFNRQGGLDFHGFRAWREAHADETGTGAGELDAIEALAPVDPDVETPEARQARQAAEIAASTPAETPAAE